MICYQCNKHCNYLFDDSRCKSCTRLTPDEVSGKVNETGRCLFCGETLIPEDDRTISQHLFCGPAVNGQQN